MVQSNKPGSGKLSAILKGLAALAIGAAIVVLFYWQCGPFLSPSEHDTDKINDLERTLQDIRAAMNVDSVRQYQIQKIMKVISRFNRDMRSSQKYEVAEEIYNASVKYTNLDVDLLCATITLESGGTWNPEIVSEAGAMGLMQIMPTDGVWLAYFENVTWTTAEEILFDPIYNIRIGSRQLSALINRYGLEGGLAAFNGGEKRAAIWLANDKAEGILMEETTNYIPQVLQLYEEFKMFAL